MKNEEYMVYTYKHRKIVMYLANKYIKGDNKKLLEHIKYHDLDKLFMYMFYDKKDVSIMHRKLSFHHDNDKPKTYEDYVEMVLDWESARYTKPDKPLNAYDTLYRYFSHMEDKILPILDEFNIKGTNLPMEQDTLEYANSLIVTKDEIKKEMSEYLNKYFS